MHGLRVSDVRRKMDRKLTRDEKWLIERELVARQELAEKRRSTARRVFLLGLSAGVASAGLGEFRVPTVIVPILGVIWLISILFYVGVGVLPGPLSKDMDPRWHLNPWQEALNSLSEGKTQFEAITLLAGPPIAQMLFSFVYFAVK